MRRSMVASILCLGTLAVTFALTNPPKTSWLPVESSPRLVERLVHHDGVITECYELQASPAEVREAVRTKLGPCREATGLASAVRLVPVVSKGLKHVTVVEGPAHRVGQQGALAKRETTQVWLVREPDGSTWVESSLRMKLGPLMGIPLPSSEIIKSASRTSAP